MYKKGKCADSSRRCHISRSKTKGNEQEERGNTVIKLTSRDELILMNLYSNTGYFLECFPYSNLIGTFGKVDGMNCFRIEQPIVLSDQLLYCHATHEKTTPMLSYLERSRTKVQLNGYAYGRSFFVTNLQAVGCSANLSGTSLLPSVQSPLSEVICSYKSYRR